MATSILSDNGASSGSAGLKSTADSSGVLVLQTTTSGGTATNAVYIDNNQNVGFGTSTPSAPLDVYTSSVAVNTRLGPIAAMPSSQTACYVGSSLNAVTGTGTNGDLLLIPRSSTTANIVFATGNGTPTVKAVLDSSGGLKTYSTIGVGNTAPSTSGAGITFPATQSASTDANTLDDYEEGTFTPTDASGAGLSFSSAYGRYIKVGKFVTAWIDITYPSTASGSNAAIGSFPFTAGGGGSNPAFTGSPGYSTASRNMVLEINSSTTATVLNMGFSTPVTNAQLSTQRSVFVVTYPASA